MQPEPVVNEMSQPPYQTEALRCQSWSPYESFDLPLLSDIDQPLRSIRHDIQFDAGQEEEHTIRGISR